MPPLFVGALKSVGIIIAGIVGAVMVLGFIGLLLVTVDFFPDSDTSADKFRHIDDDFLFMAMTPDEREDELRAMLAGEKAINCEFLVDADDHAEGLLPLGALGGLSRDEMALWRDVRNLYSISGC